MSTETKIAERWSDLFAKLHHPARINFMVSDETVATLIKELSCAEAQVRQLREAQAQRVSTAFDMIARANTVSILTLGEMESIVNRALLGEFDNLAATVEIQPTLFKCLADVVDDHGV